MFQVKTLRHRKRLNNLPGTSELVCDRGRLWTQEDWLQHLLSQPFTYTASPYSKHKGFQQSQRGPGILYGHNHLLREPYFWIHTSAPTTPTRNLWWLTNCSRDANPSNIKTPSSTALGEPSGISSHRQPLYPPIIPKDTVPSIHPMVDDPNDRLGNKDCPLHAADMVVIGIPTPRECVSETI